jgi:uncharacterized protein (DUF58 family)
MAITGRAVLLTLLGVIPVALAPGWATFFGWVAVVVAVVVTDLFLAGSPRAVTVARVALPSVRLGQPIEAPVELFNQGRRRVRGLVRDGWQPSAGAEPGRQRLDLPPGQRRRLNQTLTPTRRGDRISDQITIRSIGPLGIAARQLVISAPGALRVLPPFGSRRHLPSRLARLRELDGRTATRIRGMGTEFDSLREYVPGDDVRSIDWRATARRQQVVIRTWRPERDRRVLLVLDTSRTSAARVGDAPRLDAAMDAALLLAALASRAGDHVELLAMDRRVRASVRNATRTELLPRMVDALAPLEPELIEADWTAVIGAVLSQLDHRALVVLLTPLEAAAVEEGLLPTIHHLIARHHVLIASVDDPDVARLAAGRGDAHAVYGAAAAARAGLDRAAITAQLLQLGADVIDAAPDDLPPRLADRYLTLKATGKL